MIGNEGNPPEACEDCGELLVSEVLSSPAGYYIGVQCNCGPYSRESDYFASWEDAHAELADWLSTLDDPDLPTPRVHARTPGFHPDPEFTVIEIDPGEFVPGTWRLPD